MGKIISRRTAQREIGAGRAVEVSLLTPDDRGRRYVAFDRLSTQETAHYLATDADVWRLGAQCKAQR